MTSRLALVLLLLLPVLAGCSGTRFGEALSRSFSAATPADSQAAVPSNGATPAAGAPPAASGATAPPQSGAPNRPAGTGTAAAPAAGARSGKPGGSSPPSGPTDARPTAGSGTAASGNASGRPASTASALPPRPAPYRVTILLPQADAAAPAEVVTQALRAAGVPFEVETIERLGRGSASASPQAPVSRPAPEPR